jgi:hypothetical protein
VSGRTPRGGGWLIRITDSGSGMPEEQLRQLNWQLANPPLADAAVARHMGLFAVGHLAAPHGIRVTLEPSQAGGTAVEVHIPAELITGGGWPRPSGEVLRTGSGGGAATATATEPSWPSAPRFATRPAVVTGPETATSDAVPSLLGAPLTARDAAPSSVVTVPEPPGSPTGGLPIFESVESEYSGTRRTGTAAADLPQRIAPARPVPVAERETRQLAAAEAAWIGRSRLASFQRGSHRARTEAGEARPAEDD